MNRLVSVAIGAALLALTTNDHAWADPAAPAIGDEARASSQPATSEPAEISDAVGPTAPTEDAPSDPDPAESANRAIFAGNEFVDNHLLKPVARAYEDNVPAGVRQSLHDFVANLGEPSVL